MVNISVIKPLIHLFDKNNKKNDFSAKKHLLNRSGAATCRIDGKPPLARYSSGISDKKSRHNLKTACRTGQNGRFGIENRVIYPQQL